MSSRQPAAYSFEIFISPLATVRLFFKATRTHKYYTLFIMTTYQAVPADDYDYGFDDNDNEKNMVDLDERQSANKWLPLFLFGTVAVAASIATVSYVNSGLLTYPSIDDSITSYSSISHHEQRALFTQFKSKFARVVST